MPSAQNPRKHTAPQTVTSRLRDNMNKLGMAVAVLRDEATHNRQIVPRPSHEEAAEAVKTLLRYAGDNPDREGLMATDVVGYP